MKKSILLIVILLLLIGAGCEKTDDLDLDIPSLSLSILTEGPFTIGDHIDIALTIYHEKGKSIAFPREEEHFAPFSLKEISVTKKRARRAIHKTIVLYTLASYETGEMILNPLEVTVASAHLETEPLSIPILSVLPKDGQNLEIKDIKQPYPAKIRPIAIIAPLLGVIAGIPLSLFLIKLLFKKRQSKQRPSFESVKIDPFQFSLTELENIKRAHRENRTDSKQVYSSLSFILRFFIGSILNIGASKMTTNELKRYIRKQRMHSLISSGFMNLLSRSDAVKFAKAKPQDKQVEQDINESIGIVKKTKHSFDEAEKQKLAEKKEGAYSHGV